MAIDLSLGILGTLVGTVAGSIVGGWFGLKQTRIQQEAENKRHRSGVFLDEKADRLSRLYDKLIEATSLSSSPPNRNHPDISEGLLINESDSENPLIPSSQELSLAHQHAALFISEKEDMKKVSDAVGLWLPVLRAIESDFEGTIRIKWEDLPVRDSIRKYPEKPLTHEEVKEISDDAVSVLRTEIHDPISEL